MTIILTKVWIAYKIFDIVSATPKLLKTWEYSLFSGERQPPLLPILQRKDWTTLTIKLCLLSFLQEDAGQGREAVPIVEDVRVYVRAIRSRLLARRLRSIVGICVCRLTPLQEQLLFLKEARKNGDQGIRQNVYRCSLEDRSLWRSMHVE